MPLLRFLLPALIALGLLQAEDNHAIVLRGDTSKPVLSTYALGEKVALRFTASGPGDKLSAATVMLRTVDAHGKTLDQREVPLHPEGGNFVAAADMPADQLGFYRVYAKLSTGEELQGLGSRPPGFLTYAVVPDPALRVDYGEKETRFGMQGGFGAWADESLAYLGARWVLDSQFEWRTREPAHSGQFSASSYHPPEPRGSNWRSSTLPTLFAAPEWAVIPGTFAYMTGALTPDGEKAWAAYCREAAKAYMAKNPERTERIYQITWEPISPWGYKGTDEQLIKIFEIAHAALHEVDDKAVVAGPTKGIMPEDIRQSLPLFQLGLGRYLDVVSLHPYFSIEPEKDGMVAAIRSLKDGVRKFSGRDIPMIGTEQGYSTEEDPAKDIIQARGLLRQNLITLGEGFDFNMTYYIVDYRLGEQKGYGYYYNLVDGIPWGPAKASPRPVVPAYAAQSLLLDGHKSGGAIEWLGGTIWGYVFERDQDIILALWDYGTNESKPVTIPTGVKEVTVFDWMGNSRREPTTHGNLTVALGPEPVYIKGVVPTLWGSGAGRQLELEKPAIIAFPGETAVIKGLVKLDGASGKIGLEPDARLGVPASRQDLAPNKDGASFNFALAIPATATPDTYPVRLSLENGDGVIAIRGGSLQVKPPVSVTAIDQTAGPGGAKAVAVALHEEQGRPARGKVGLQLRNVADSAQNQNFQIAPRGDARIIFTFPKASLENTITYQAQADVTLENGYAFSQSSPVNFLAAARCARVPLGSGDWSAAPAVTLNKRQLIRSPQEYSGDPDLGGVIQFQWDDRALYLRATIKDDTFQQQYEGENTWKEDALQLAFNLDPRKKENRTGNLLADDANRQRKGELAVALTPKGPQVFRHVTFDPQKFPPGPLPANAFRADIRRDESSHATTYLVTIPWTTLGGEEPPRAGESIGLALTVNDSDSAAQKDPSALGLFGGIFPTKDSRKFGLLLLGP